MKSYHPKLGLLDNINASNKQLRLAVAVQICRLSFSMGFLGGGGRIVLSGPILEGHLAQN